MNRKKDTGLFKKEQSPEERATMIRGLARKLDTIVGFRAVSEKGYSLDEGEKDAIVDYCEARGAEREKVYSVLDKMGRPFETSDQHFSAKCRLCHTLRNYCCC
jgi:hypothetical protein